MVDYEKIGRRIAEERKRFRKMTQEQLADALNIYQADVSNLERARKGSGITDLDRLDQIAEFFEMPLENLIFGIGRGDRMEIYQGSKMQLKAKASDKKLPAAHKKLLQVIIGAHADADKLGRIEYQCGPYTVYRYFETQTSVNIPVYDENGKMQHVQFEVPKLHFYVIYDNEVIATMTVTVSSMQEHLHLDTFQCLQHCIPRQVFDPMDVRRHLNPYWMLYYLSENPESGSQYIDDMEKRFKALHGIKDVQVLYIESVYVKEDCRQKGILRLMLDCLKYKNQDSIMWLNMEPTSGDELTSEYDFFPDYTPADLGQINLNASIAEKLGFTVDPDTWHRKAEVLDDDGNTRIEEVLIRKCAYYMPKTVRKILQNDGDLVEVGRALQKLKQPELDERNKELGIDQNPGSRVWMTDAVDAGFLEGYFVMELPCSEDPVHRSGPDVFCFIGAVPNENKFLMGVARKSVFKAGLHQQDMLEQYHNSEDATNSAYFGVLEQVLEHLNELLPDVREAFGDQI